MRRKQVPISVVVNPDGSPKVIAWRTKMQPVKCIVARWQDKSYHLEQPLGREYFKIQLYDQTQLELYYNRHTHSWFISKVKAAWLHYFLPFDKE